MNLQRIISRVYSLDLPITGGCGESIDDAIIFMAEAGNHFVEMEYKIINYIADLQLYKFTNVEQTLIKKCAKYLDRITVKATCFDDPSILVKHYYFDITACFNNFKLNLK